MPFIFIHSCLHFADDWHFVGSYLFALSECLSKGSVSCSAFEILVSYCHNCVYIVAKENVE